MVKQTKHRIRQLLLVFGAIALAFYIYWQNSYLERVYPQPITEGMDYLPSGDFLKGVALAYDAMLADYYWIKVISYYGSQKSAQDLDPQKFSSIIEIINKLDPLFQYPYEFGGMLLASEMGKVGKSTEILKNGMEHVPEKHPRYWYLPFNVAFNYMYYTRDYKTSAQYLERAASYPKSPTYLPLLVSRLYANADFPDLAIPFLQEKIKSTNDPELKENYVVRLKSVVDEKNLQIIEKIVKAFEKKFRKIPESVDELITSGLVPELPPHPFGGKYLIDKKDGTVKSSTADGKLQIHRRN